MEKKRRKANLKKFIAMLCIFVLLQTYFSYFAEIAIAVDELISISGQDKSEAPEEEEANIESEVVQEEQVGDNQTTEQEDEQESIDGENQESLPQELNEEENSVVNEEEQQEELGTIEDETIVENDEESQEEQNEDIVEEVPFIEPKIELEVTSENASIYKGYLYANATSELRYATNYNTIDVVSIVGGKNMESFTVQDEPDKIQLITNTKIGLMSLMYYRQTRISVEEFKNILGEDGSIILYTPEGDIIGYINKNCDVVNNEYVFAYPMQLNSVRFEFTNIIADGTISIKNDKAIKESSDFGRNQISLFSTINTISSANVYGGEEVKTCSAEGNINLEETESRMTIDVDTETLSVEDKNNLTINVTLKTDEERYDLFENPTIEIEFPSAVEDVEVTGMNLLYKNGLSIDTWNVDTNILGKKVLKVNLVGSQLEYTPGAVQEGTTLVMYTDVDVNRLTADTSEALKMTYTNKDTVRKTYSLEGKDSEDVTLEFVGRQELVRAMQITEANVATATSYDEQAESIQIKTNEEQTINIVSSIVNNYEATLQDVVIVGRIPFVGNKDGNGNDLGTNFDTVLQGALTTSGIIADVYYSEDGAATESSDSWSKDLENLSNYKSYKIVVREKTLAKGEKLSFEYNLTVPASVGYNAKAYTNYVVYYKIDKQNYSNQCAVGMYTETKEIDMDDIEEEARQEVATLTVGTQVSQGGIVLGETDTVYERQVLKYTVVVRNTSNKSVTNINIKGKGINSNLYDWEYTTVYNYMGMDEYTVRKMKEFSNDEKEWTEFSLESLAPNESKTFEYQVIVKDLSEIENPEVYGEISISADNMNETITQTIRNQVVDAEIETRVMMANYEESNDDSIYTSQVLQMNLLVRNIYNNNLKDVETELILSKNVSLNEYMSSFDKNLKYDIKDGVNNRIIKFYIPELKVGEEKNIFFVVNLESIDTNILSSKIEITSNTKVNNNVYTANDYIRRVYQSETTIDYNWYSNVESGTKVSNGDEITFYMDVENKGIVLSKIINLDFNRPFGLEIISATLTIDGEDKELNIIDEKEVRTEFSLDSGEKATLVINTKVNEQLLTINQNLIEVQIEANYGIDNYKSSVLSYSIDNKYMNSLTEEIEIPENEENGIEENNQEISNNSNQENLENDINEEENNKEEINIQDNEKEIENTLPQDNKIQTNNTDNNKEKTEDVKDHTNNNNENIKQTNNSEDSNLNKNEQTNNNLENRDLNKNEQTNNNYDLNDSETESKEITNNVITQNQKIIQNAQKQTYSISGKAWIDINEDGIRQNNEQSREAVVVSLYKANGNGGLDTTSLIAITATDSEGLYQFSGVEEGQYIVVFDYNSSRYKVTKYQVSTAKTTENSDAISKTLTIDGETQVLGVTDVLTVSNISLVNIDIGLVDKTNFDLSLEKTISSITVNNDEGTKTYNYDKGINEKLEIRSKYYKSTVLDITYNFKIKNEGDVSGYVNKVVDYLPEDVEVILNSSPDWYIGSDNGLYYTGLLDNEIASGETKEFTLVVRKSLANGEALKLVNSAEIVESTNNQGLFDKDSIENNKMKAEDDFGTTTLTISVATGNTIQYITIIFIITSMIVVIVIMGINFKNTKKIYK